MTPLSVRPRKNSVSTLTTSPCVYEFCCSSGCKYIGRTVRNLSTRIGEHIPSWLRLEGNGMSKSVILRHLYPITHRIDTEKVVKVIYRAKNKQSHLLKLSLFARVRLMFVQRSKWWWISGSVGKNFPHIPLFPSFLLGWLGHLLVELFFWLLILLWSLTHPSSWNFQLSV